MSAPPSTRIGLVLASAALFLGAGCGGKGELPVFPVKGRVTVDNVPLTSGIVGLHPESEDNTLGETRPWGRLDSKGYYSVLTQGKAGAPLGSYKITVRLIEPPEDDAAPRPNARYAKAETTDLHYEVTESPSPGAFDLKLTH